MDGAEARKQAAHSCPAGRVLPGKRSVQGSAECGAGAGVEVVSVAEEQEGGDEEIFEAW